MGSFTTRTVDPTFFSLLADLLQLCAAAVQVPWMPSWLVHKSHAQAEYASWVVTCAAEGMGIRL